MMMQVIADKHTRKRPSQSDHSRIAGEPEEELLRIKDAMKILNCSSTQCYRLVNEGEIPSIRMRGMVRIPRHKLMKWIEANSAAGRSA